MQMYIGDRHNPGTARQVLITPANAEIMFMCRWCKSHKNDLCKNRNYYDEKRIDVPTFGLHNSACLLNPLTFNFQRLQLAKKKKNRSVNVVVNFSVAEQIRFLTCALFSAMIRIGLALMREQFWESGRFSLDAVSSGEYPDAPASLVRSVLGLLD